MYPQWGWLIPPAIILLVFFHWKTLTDFAAIQKLVSLVLRCIIIGLVVAAICNPVFLRQVRQQRILFAVDQSASIDQAARVKADEFIAAALAAAEGQDVEFQFLPFAASPLGLQSEWTPAAADQIEETATERPDSVNVASADDADGTAAADTLPDEDTPETQTASADVPAEIDEDKPLPGTNLTAALQTAIAALPPSRVPRIVLLSDGNPTAGQDFLANIAAGGVPVDTVPLPVRSEPEVQLTRVQAPSQVRQGQPFYVEVVVTTNQATEGYVDLFRGDIRIGGDDQKPVTLKPGENRFRFRQSVEGKRQETFAARLRQFNDTLLDNNESSAIVYAVGRPRVLMIDRDVDETDSLRWALDEQSIDLEVRPPEGLPADLAELQAYECLVLSNIPATLLSLRQMDLIRLYVQDLGGGFIMLGGDESFGLGGYYRTQIEEILPVRSNFEKEKEKPSLAMMLVIDKSGSMGGQKMELARDAAKAAVELLGPKDAIGVVAFDGDSYTVAELRTASDKGRIIDQISTIEASGGTNMYPAMVDAFEALQPASARLKHVILMTDGISSPGDFEGVASDMSASRMTLSTIALGQGSSEALLEQLAEIGGGRYYFCDDPQAVPQVFAKETMEASKSAINEQPFVAQVVRPTPVLKDIEVDLSPLLLGYVVTRPKPTAEFILASESGDPLLVWWRYGLGMSVAFTSDAKARWAAEWLTWPDFGPFWAQVIRHAMRKDESKGIYVDLRREGTDTIVEMDAVDKNGRFIDSVPTTLTVIDPKLKRSKFELTQTAPGRFSGRIPTADRGSYHLDLLQQRSVGETERVSRGVTVGYSDELKLLPVGESTLQQIARMTGGRYDVRAADIVAEDQRTAREPFPLWSWLLMTALAVFIADVALRRIEIWPADD